MYTRCFERESINGYEVINISEYGFEYYINNDLEKTGLVDDYTKTINDLICDGWEEVL